LHEMWGLIEVFEDFTGVRLDKPQH
jgi:hypothetical protein